MASQNKQKHLERKSQKHYFSYMDALANNTEPNIPTDKNNNFNLIGSNETSPTYSTSGLSTEAKTTSWFKIKNWIKDHMFESIAAPLLLTFLIWGVNSIYSMNISKEILITEINYLKDSIKNIESNYTEKESLNYQLEAIKNEIIKDTKIDYENIKVKLDYIEKQIDLMN